MHGSANAANALRPYPGFPRIATAQNQLDPPEHRARTPGVGDLMPIHLGLNAKVALDTCNRIDNDACHLLSLWRCAILLRDGRCGFGMMPVGDGVPDAMRHGGGGDPAHEGPTNLTCSDVHAESGRMRQAFVEWRFGVPKARGRAGDAAVTRLDWPTGGVVPAYCVVSSSDL